MEWLPALLGGLVALPAGWVMGRYQHLLYRQPRFRAEPLRDGAWRRLPFVVAAVLAGAIVLALRPDHYDAGPALLTALFATVLIVLSSCDFERRIIPNNLVQPAILAALLLCWAWTDRSVADCLWGGAFGLAVGGGLFALGMLTGSLMGISITPFGLGDVRLIIFMGLLTGWPAIMTVLFIGVILGGVPALAMMFTGRSRRAYSYGPYLAAGGLYALLFMERFT
jgi:leader peptidase (prepilin peptidase)/N-methyltransferase